MFNENFYEKIAYQQLFHDFLESQMEEQRIKTLKTLGTIVDQNYADDFAKILCAAIDNDCDEAKRIWDNLGFNASDFFAILGNSKSYFEVVQQEKETSFAEDCYMERYYE